jgi:polar amino acid transport system permease protein
MARAKIGGRPSGPQYLRWSLVVFGAVASFLALFWLISFVIGFLPPPIGPEAALFREGAQLTLLLTVYSGVLGLALGVIVGLGRLSRSPVLSVPAGLYVWVLRGTPLLVQILFVYFALPELLPFLKKGADVFLASLALGLNLGAYNAEVVRAGVMSVPRGQTEAARSLGLGSIQTMVSVVMPQALRIALPPLVNNIIALLKDTSLLTVISMVELTTVAQRLAARTFLPVPILATAAAIYLALTTVLNIYTNWLERELARGRAR